MALVADNAFCFTLQKITHKTERIATNAIGKFVVNCYKFILLKFLNTKKN